jgi:hypothetical protein
MFLFAAISWVAAALALMAAILVVASFFLAAHPVSGGYLGVHLVVAALFLVIGFLFGGTA